MAQITQSLGKHGVAVAVGLFLLIYGTSAAGFVPKGLDANSLLLQLFGAVLMALTNSGGKAQE
jgi:hypothetical protein